ncbi:MAG TPA: peptide ABC transporter substrate-binding protein [Rhizomicrobium sp.]|nr:peptide ABC transporter substrate-binding protein [Rhizomicrobium sp.]
MAQTQSGFSRRALLGGGAVVAVVGGAAFSLRGGPMRRTTYDAKTFNRGNGAEPDTLDPQKTQTSYENNIVGDMFMGLMTEDAAARPIYGAAESMTESDDGLTYTFKIRNHTWSDGVPVTAHDFEFSFRRILDPKTAAPYASLLYPIVNAEKVNGGKLPVTALGVRAIDDQTLEMNFEFQVPYLRQLLTHYTCMPVPRHVVEKHGDQWLQPQNVATNGAYILKEWVPNDHITSVKNPRFYDADNVRVETVNYYPVSDYAAALKRFRAGEFDVNWGVPSSEIAWLRQNIPGALHVAPYVGTSYIVFNVTRAPFNDVRVRQAVNMAIDREIIANRVMHAGEIPAYAFVPNGIPNYPGKAALRFKSMSMHARIAKAKALLAEAGYGPSNPLRFAYSFQGTSDARLVAVALQSMWAGAGMDVDLVSAETAVHYNQLRRQHFQAAWAGWSADYLDAKDFLFLVQTSANDMNNGRYSNPRFDMLVDQADDIRDPVERGVILQQAEQIMLDDVALSPVFFTVSRNIVSRQVKNWVDNELNINRTRYVWLDRTVADT